MDKAKMELKDYLGCTTDCDCGRPHRIDTEIVEISAGALEKVPGIVRTGGFKKPFVVSDCNTFEIAGRKLQTLLVKEDVAFSSYVFSDEHLVPDEYAVGRLLMRFDPECDLLLGVGSGTLNDICRFLSFRLKIPYYIVATAPSMDGYASTGAPLIMNTFKTNFECAVPKAIIADLEIIANAPKKMIAAGFGDVIGKSTGLVDWELSAIINNEYYCERTVNMVRQSLYRTIAVHEGIANRKKEAIAELMEALILAGFAMTFAKSSRPASGSEHRLSHFWEIRHLLAGQKGLLHGTKVGIATVLVCRLYELIQGEVPDVNRILPDAPPSLVEWEEQIKSAYLSAAPEVIRLEEQTQKNCPQGWQLRIPVIAKKWPEILEVMKKVPSPGTISEMLSKVGGIVNPTEAGIPANLVYEGLLFAKEIRVPYTILQLLWDLHLLDDYASRIVNNA